MLGMVTHLGKIQLPGRALGPFSLFYRLTFLNYETTLYPKKGDFFFPLIGTLLPTPSTLPVAGKTYLDLPF